jgi:hypothetical protein
MDSKCDSKLINDFDVYFWYVFIETAKHNKL